MGDLRLEWISRWWGGGASARSAGGGSITAALPCTFTPLPSAMIVPLSTLAAPTVAITTIPSPPLTTPLSIPIPMGPLSLAGPTPPLIIRTRRRAPRRAWWGVAIIIREELRARAWRWPKLMHLMGWHGRSPMPVMLMMGWGVAGWAVGRAVRAEGRWASLLPALSPAFAAFIPAFSHMALTFSFRLQMSNYKQKL